MRKLALLFVVALTLAATVTPVIALADDEFTVMSTDSTGPFETASSDVAKGPRWVVEFEDSADLTPTSRIADRVDRITAVRARLVRVAERSQATVIDALRGAGAEFEGFWLRNELVFEGTRALADSIAGIDGVARVRHERLYPRLRPVAISKAAATPEWGIEKIGADEAWAEGILGQGVVVGGIDGGVEHTHSALVDNYRGNLGGGTFDHNYNWWDPTGLCGPVPCPDPDGHGTHTMGTAVGGDGPGPYVMDVGVAPGATWIAAKGCEDFSCSESALLSSGQFMLAPTDLTGANPDPSRAPNIVNNSWSGGPGDPFYQDIVDAWVAAGIVPVFASGNPGPDCEQGGSPGDYNNVVSAGATDIDDLIADFSGRGPSAFGKVNPNVTAPGVDVVSSVPGDGFASFSGTSMAAPHTTGTLALIMSANPTLKADTATAIDILESTAHDILDDTCGGDPSGDPNNVYGDGRIDAALASIVARDGGTLTGTVTDSATSQPIEHATITIDDGSLVSGLPTDEDGRFTVLLPEGTYDLTVEAFGYLSATVTGVAVVKDETTTVDVALDAAPRFTVSGTVTRRGGAPLAGIDVSVTGTPLDPVVTDSGGSFSFELPAGSYEIVAHVIGCDAADPATVDVAGPGTPPVSIVVQPKLDLFGHGCEEIAFQWVDAQNQTALFGDDSFGRLRLPFEVEYYGQTYDTLYVDTNGYVALLNPFFSDFFHRPIPDGFDPSAAAYVLWTDLLIDGDASIDYQFLTSGDVDGVVVEWENVSLLSGEGPGSFEIKLWENGVIDMLYGDGVDVLGNGSNATIGIEDDTSTDALEYSFNSASVSPGMALRYRVVTDAKLVGTVTNVNNGKPVAGASITTNPGGRHTTTEANGTYELNMLSGDYTVDASAPLYGTASAAVTLPPDSVVDVSFELDAARARIRPRSIEATAGPNERVKAKVRVKNTGTLPLDWTATDSADPAGSRLARLLSSGIRVSPVQWGRSNLRPSGPLPKLDTTGMVRTIIAEDPAGDALEPPDVTLLDAAFTDTDIVMTMQMVDPVGEFAGYVLIDADQDPTTGVPGEEFFGLPEQEIGAEYLIDLFAVGEGVVFLVDLITFELIAEGPANVDGTTVEFAVPTGAFVAPTGTMNVAGVIGNFFGPTDWIPDVGNAQLPLAGFDAKWIKVKPAAGSVAVGERQKVKVILKSKTLSPGEYHGIVTFRSNDPFKSRIELRVTFVVTGPAPVADPGR